MRLYSERERADEKRGGTADEEEEKKLDADASPPLSSRKATRRRWKWRDGGGDTYDSAFLLSGDKEERMNKNL